MHRVTYHNSMSIPDVVQSQPVHKAVTVQLPDYALPLTEGLFRQRRSIRLLVRSTCVYSHSSKARLANTQFDTERYASIYVHWTKYTCQSSATNLVYWTGQPLAHFLPRARITWSVSQTAVLLLSIMHPPIIGHAWTLAHICIHKLWTCTRNAQCNVAETEKLNLYKESSLSIIFGQKKELSWSFEVRVLPHKALELIWVGPEERAIEK